MRKKSTMWPTLALLGVLLGVLVLCYVSYGPTHPTKKRGTHIQSVNSAPSVSITLTNANTATNILPSPRQ